MLSPIAASPAPRFGSIIPIVSVTNVAQDKTIPINDRVDFEYVDMAVSTLEDMVYGYGPYKTVHPELLSGRDEQQFVTMCRELRDKLLTRLALIDSDYERDAQKRVAVARPNGNDCFLLTGQDAQGYLEAEALDQRIRALRSDPVLTDPLANQQSELYTAEAARIRRATKSPRSLNLHVAAIPGVETLSGLLAAKIFKIPRGAITDLTVS